MEGISLQTPSAPCLTPSRSPTYLNVSGAISKRFSLSFSSNLGHPLLLSKTHQAFPPLDAPSSRFPTVWCCSSHPLTKGSVKPAIDWSITVKSFIEADEKTQALLLKRIGSELVPGLKGTCIYLVGMMGSGKTTVGKLLAEALGYEFFDSDKLIEDAAGGITVAQFFKQQDEEKFRNAETDVLKKLSCNGRSVVATGGGIVVRDVNWNYLRHGVTVWLDVPLEALAERVVAVGTHTRPLLGDPQGGSAYSQALARLSSIYELRAPYYEKADIIVSLQKLASHLGCKHARDLTPILIVLQVLEEINRKSLRNKQTDAANVA
eukprot:c11554_g1_i1 orf=230-1189(+)